jgi:hypothetical protein
MDRQEDSQAYMRVVAMLLALAAIAVSAGALPARKRIVLLAVLRQAASVACTFAAKIHAPCLRASADRRFWPASGENEAAELAEVFGALACALAFPARAAIRAARRFSHRTFGFHGESSGAAPGFVARPSFADTS